MNIFSLLNNVAEQQPFLTDLRCNKTYSYGDLHHASVRLADFLAARLVFSGDKVVYFTVNSGFFFPLLFACALRKAALVPLNPKMRADELTHIVKQLQPKVVFYDQEFTDLEEVLRNFERVPVNGQDMLCLAHSVGNGPTVDLPDVEDCDGKIVLIIYTSGTTTNSKGVGLTHKNLLTMAGNFTAFYGFRVGQKFFSMLPFYHINAPMITGLACINAKAHVYVGDVYGFGLARSFWDIVEKYRIQVLSITPSIMASLLAIYPDGMRKDISSLEYALVGTAYLKEELWKVFEGRFNISCFQGYGLTETTTWATMTPRDARKRYDSAGIPVGCEVRIDSSALLVAEGMPLGSGEVLIKGDIIMKGYWGNPDATKAILNDGWLRTGDVGFIDQDDQLVIVGRIKNIVKRKGQLVIPEDIDAVIGRFSGVVESCTFGLPDDMLGEKVIAACVMENRDKRSEEYIYDCALQNLSAQNMPDQFVFFKRLPKNDVGKVNLRTLKEHVSGQTSRDIFTIFDKARYRKARTPDREAILEIIQAALQNDAPFYLTGYWGVGRRGCANEHDRAVLDNLCKLADEAGQVLTCPH